jgi:hypothetical protein
LTEASSDGKKELTNVSSQSSLAPPAAAGTLGRNRRGSGQTKDFFFTGKTKVIQKSKSPWFDDEFEIDLNEKFKEVVGKIIFY